MNTEDFPNLSNPITSRSQVCTLIPQKDPVVMLDQLLECDAEQTITLLEIKEDNIFVQEGEFSESGVIENMAQTIAIRQGYYFSMTKQTSSKGLIGAVRNFTLLRLPKTGEILECRIQVLQEVFGVTLVDCASYVDSKLIASGQIKTVEEKPIAP